MPGRLMVGRFALNEVIGVQIPAGQQMKTLIQKYKEARTQFEAMVDAFPKEKREIVLFGEWSLKDMLAHLTGWERQSLHQVASLLQGTSPRWVNDVDRFNAQSVQSSKLKNWETVYSELIASGNKIIQVYEQLPESEWHKQAGPHPKFTPKRFLEASIEHNQGEHLLQIEEQVVGTHRV